MKAIGLTVGLLAGLVSFISSAVAVSPLELSGKSWVTVNPGELATVTTSLHNTTANPLYINRIEAQIGRRGIELFPEQLETIAPGDTGYSTLKVTWDGKTWVPEGRYIATVKVYGGTTPSSTDELASRTIEVGFLSIGILQASALWQVMALAAGMCLLIALPVTLYRRRRKIKLTRRPGIKK